jgi:hypothetical protein
MLRESQSARNGAFCRRRAKALVEVRVVGMRRLSGRFGLEPLTGALPGKQ